MEDTYDNKNANTNTHSSSCNCCHPNNNFNQNPHLSQDYINQARNQINNMSDNEFNDKSN